MNLITIFIMVWAPWTGTLRRAWRGRGRPPAGTWTTPPAPGARRGRPVDGPAAAGASRGATSSWPASRQQRHAERPERLSTRLHGCPPNRWACPPWPERERAGATRHPGRGARGSRV